MLKIVLTFAVIFTSYCWALDLQLDNQWNEFKKRYGKAYKDGAEEEVRRRTFEHMIAYIMLHNFEADLEKLPFTLGMNEFGDTNSQDFVKQFTGFKSNATAGGSPWTENGHILKYPESVDWSEEGFVSPVENQGLCASSWAFSAAGALEAQNKKKLNKLIILSPQNLIDCSSEQGNEGCKGGNTKNAFEYARITGGIDTEDFYSYTAKTGDSCNYKRGALGSTCSGFLNLPSGDENALKKAVGFSGPVSVAIDASHLSFQLYKNGIYLEPKCSDQNLNHAVLVVGYGREDNTDYWLIKNSWGTSWGMNGYAKIIRNHKNHCGIASEAVLPQV